MSRSSIQVMALQQLHVIVDGRSLCGRVKVDPADCYPDESALRAWNGESLERCGKCADALMSRVRNQRQEVR